MKRFLRSGKKSWPILLALVLLLAAAVLLRGFHIAECGRLVSGKEWQFYQGFFRAQVFAEYGENSAAAQKALGKYTAQAVRRDDRLRRLATEKGVAPLPNFSFFEQELQKVNRQRAIDAAAGRPIYGTVEYSLENYYAQLRGQCENDLAQILVQQVLENPKLMQEAYDRMTASDFMQSPKAQLRAYCPEDETKIELLQKELLQDPELSEQQAEQRVGCPIQVKTYRLDSKTLSRDESFEQQLLLAAVECGEGGQFLFNEKEVCVVQQLEGIGKPELEQDPVSVAVWQARNIFEEQVGPLS